MPALRRVLGGDTDGIGEGEMKKNKDVFELEIMPGVFINRIDIMPLTMVFSFAGAIILFPFYIYHKYIKKDLEKLTE